MIKKALKSTILISILASTLCMASDNKYNLDFTKQTKGEIRKLEVYKNPKWVSKINFSNEKSAFFSSPKSMFEFYFTKDKWKPFNISVVDDFENIIVTDYKTLKAINARKAHYVYGSNKISPAGDDLVAFKALDDARDFMKTNNGKRIFRFSQIQDALIRLLNGRI